MNLTLIGMAAAGKTHIGKKLAEHLGFAFTDIDEYLEARHGKSIQKQLDEIGEEEYLEREMRALIDATKGREGLLISPGGSIVYREIGMDHVKDISTVVYLRVSLPIIEERLRDRAPRAVIGLGRKTVRELYEERHPLYTRHADLVVDLDGKPSQMIVGEIIAALVARRLIPSELAATNAV